MSNYVVVPTSNIDYQSWQIKLLLWSKKKVKQEGNTILLVSADIENRPFDEYIDPTVERYILPNWAQEWRDQNNNDNWGGIPNKYNALKWMTENLDLNDDDQLLFLDPDMIFIEPVEFNVGPNEIIGARWYFYTPLHNWPKKESGFMYPFIIQFGTLKKLANKYSAYCQQIRKDTGEWISEMWALDYATKDCGIKVRIEDNLGHCTAWWNMAEFNELPKIIHFPNEILNKDDERIWFKQDFTFNQDMDIPFQTAKTEIGKELLRNVTQYQTNYLYWLNWQFNDLFDHGKYDGSNGCIAFKPWPGGFNNIRMSLELAVAMAYITNRKLMLPPTYSMYLLEGESNLGDFFDLDDLGVETVEFPGSWEDVENSFKKISLLNKDNGRDESCDLVINFEKINPNPEFKKWKRVINWGDLVTEDDEYIFFDGNLLGNFYQVFHSNKMQAVKRLIARHVHYKKEIFDKAWEAVDHIGDVSYYAIHIRRNDFQYTDVRVSCEDICENIKDRVPEGSKLYIATDHRDRSFFDPLVEKYDVWFYENVAPDDVEPNIIPIIEQLVCTRAKLFIGMDYSTLSTLVYRMRGYMGDVEDIDYHVNTYPYKVEDQTTYEGAEKFIANWHREYKDVWHMSDPDIFLSIASYRDSQVDETIKSALENADNPERVMIGLGLQDTTHYLNYIEECNFPNLRIDFTPYNEVRTVVGPRNDIINRLYCGEDYFFQVDSHTRFKKGWDNILIGQIKALPERSIISTYPNEFIYPDPDKQYLNLPHNAPLVFDRFISNNIIDKRFKSKNLDSLKDFEVVDNCRACAGLLFAPAEWLSEVKIPDGIVYNGEEDYLTYATLLKGWEIKVPSEAVVWHNYDFRDKNGKPYRDFNPNLGKDYDDKSIELINDLLFNQTHERGVEDISKHLGVDVSRTSVFKIKTFVITIPRLEHRLNDGFWESHDMSSIINPEVFYGVDGRQVKPQEWWDKLTPGYVCNDPNIDVNVMGSLIQGYVNLFDKIISDRLEDIILILEDDSIILEDIGSNIDKELSEFIYNLPKDWEIAYIGGHAHNAPTENKVNDFVYTTRGLMRTTAVLYRNYHVCERLKNCILDSQSKDPIDVELLKCIGKHTFKAYRSNTKMLYQRSYPSSSMKEGIEIYPYSWKTWN